MSAPRASRASRSLPRSFSFAALAALLLLGIVDFHPAEEAAAPLAGPQLYFPDAAHGEQPCHLDSAAAVERPHCTACFRGLQGRGAAIAASARHGIVPLAGRVIGHAAAAPAAAPRPTTRGRAPPRA